ncbi:hypothetical protein AB0K18_40510 [Nonomuraea sp. NPDC049421]|uniref:hypothetical protein n=1 Tax=Nonomuraea sp. NPDC049421 TaxID=3155275 RepID=UPI0034331388
MDYKVTRSLLLSGAPARKQERLAEEARVLDEHFPSWRLYWKDEQNTMGIAVGTLQVDFAGHEYGLQIILPSTYPHALPEILPHGWIPSPNPHLIGDGLCVMRSNQWHSYMTIAFLVAKTALWLNKYEIYINRGIWPGAEQHPHGLIYRTKKWLNGL